eukprot:gnl/MRDRNA2_/MRDRNA2_70676_c0_seq2.p1 gnl/MRDRNA2_/MRDRNA2_70676_c0~~gnl/MRDRNA2_/MRDRNA2_70676_c0_seq2.p1  ORF type:complete len:492 (+),score=78.02 gnl/MRDRNA2_/MRDRNA2_70676_c0_seq2:73-1476(+)
MGSAASAAGIQGAVGSASTDDLRATLAGLPNAERARLISALQDVQCKRPTVPATLDEVDAEYITFALKDGGHIQEGTRIVSLEKIKFGREKGYMGDKCMLKEIKYEPAAPDAPSSIFVKLFPTDFVVPVPIGAVVGMYQMEVNFVTRMHKDLPDSNDFKVPQFYFAESDTEDGKPPRFVILMEPISGKPVDMITFMPVEHALRVAKDVAILHAPYWGWSYERYRNDERFKGCGHIEDAGTKQMLQGMFAMGSKAGPQIFGENGPLSATQLQDFSGYAEFWRFWEAEIAPLLQTRWVALLARWCSMPMTLVHGDLHVENMFCLEDGTNVYVDWQSVKLGPGVRDLAWLVTSSLKAEDRHEHEKTIVKAYHEALVARGVEYTWEKCWEDFVFFKIHGLWAAMLGAGMFAAKNFQEKTGIFAAEPAEDAITERTRNNLLFKNIVDDMRHSNWPAMLQALPEDPKEEKNVA